MQFDFKVLFNGPNLLTILRLLLVPVLLWFLSKTEPWAPLACFGTGIFMGITDLLDGFIGRKFGQVTDLGKALDPLVDKIFGVALVAGLYFYRDLPLAFVIFIIAKELVLAVRSLIIFRSWSAVPSANMWGKVGFVVFLLTMATYVVDALPGSRVYFLWITAAIHTSALISYYAELIRGEDS